LFVQPVEGGLADTTSQRVRGWLIARNAQRENTCVRRRRGFGASDQARDREKPEHPGAARSLLHSNFRPYPSAREPYRLAIHPDRDAGRAEPRISLLRISVTRMLRAPVSRPIRLSLWWHRHQRVSPRFATDKALLDRSGLAPGGGRARQAQRTVCSRIAGMNDSPDGGATAVQPLFSGGLDRYPPMFEVQGCPHDESGLAVLKVRLTKPG
jgi:hypothetical protein